MEKVLNYVRYSRKSSESKERQALSIQDQNAECDSLIHREDLNVIARLEESKTAFKPNKRPEFTQMIHLIESGKANAILTWKPDRLCRNPKEGGAILQLLQDGYLKEIRTATGDIYTPDSDHLILQIHFGMANQYSRNLSQNVKRGISRKIIDRKEYPRPAPVGYIGYGERGQRNIQPCPITSLFIKEAFQLASTGLHSLGYITNLLYEKGFRTKKNKKISKSHLESILRNSLYYGYFYHSREIHEGNYTPIITKGLYDLVQSKLHDRSKPKKIIWDREFLGLVKCAECNCAITTTFKTKTIKKIHQEKTFIYHHCTHRKGNCKQKPVTDTELKEMLYSEIEKIIIDQETWQLGIKLVKAKNNDEITKNKTKRYSIEKEKSTLRDQVNRLIDMRADRELTKDEFIYQKSRILEKLSSLERQTSENDISIKSWLELMEGFLNTSFDALDVVKNGNFEEKQSMLRKIGKNFLLKDKKLVFTFQEPYDILLKPTYRTNVLPNLDSNQDKRIQSPLSYH